MMGGLEGGGEWYRSEMAIWVGSKRTGFAKGKWEKGVLPQKAT